MLEGAGFRVIDLGVDLSAEKLVEQVDELKPEVLGLSALLATTMPEMQRVIATFQEKGVAEQRQDYGGRGSGGCRISRPRSAPTATARMPPKRCNWLKN